MSTDHRTDHANAEAAGLPALAPESSLRQTQPQSQSHSSPAEPSAEDPITRSVQAGLLDDPSRSRTVAGKQESANSSESEGDLEASGELAALRGNGRTVGLDMESDKSSYDSADGNVEKGGHGFGGGGGGDEAGQSGNTVGKGMNERLKALHPYGAMLGINDLESVLAIEKACFAEEQAATREKIQYRLSTCGELTFGIFSSAHSKTNPDTPTLSAPTASTSNAPDSADPNRKGILLAALVATKTENSTIQDTDMHVPASFTSTSSSSSSVPPPSSTSDIIEGHNEAGRTLALHSLAVLPDYQKLGVGTMLMRAYVQRMVEAENADRIAIITYPNLVTWYEQMGFESLGESKCKHGGGGWIDMVLEFENITPDSEEDEDEEDVDEEEELEFLEDRDGDEIMGDAVTENEEEARSGEKGETKGGGREGGGGGVKGKPVVQ